MEENKTKDFLKNNVGYFAVLLICAVYIATAVITIDLTGKSMWQILAETSLTFFLGVVINRIFAVQGIMNGEREQKVIDTNRLHGELVEKVAPYLDKLDEWCEQKNLENMRVQRTKILCTAGLKYEDYFNDNGAIKIYEIDPAKMKSKYLRKEEIKKKKVFYKALNLKLTPLTASTLTSEGGKTVDIYDFGRTKGQYQKQSWLKDAASKLLCALLFGLFGVKMIADFSYAQLIWVLFQIAAFLLMGVLKMFQAKMFVTDEYRARTIKKIDTLQKFSNYIENNKEIINE